MDILNILYMQEYYVWSINALKVVKNKTTPKEKNNVYVKKTEIS